MAPRSSVNSSNLPQQTVNFYREAMQRFQEAGIPFLVAGAHALAHHTGVTRYTKDFDMFVRKRDVDRMLTVLEEAGYETEVKSAVWLAKAFHEEESIDLIFGTGNGLAEVDDAWFDRAEESNVLGEQALLVPPEELLWTKAFIMERERFDGADVAHLLHCCASDMDWERLLDLFGSHWRVLFSHIVLFGYIYPSERDKVPRRVRTELNDRMAAEVSREAGERRVCRGSFLSRRQYLDDILDWNFADARVRPYGKLSSDEAAALSGLDDEDDNDESDGDESDEDQ